MRLRPWILVPLAAALAAGIGSTATATVRAPDPCHDRHARRLLCPDLRVAPPHEFQLERTSSGRALLRATSDLRSRGLGPLELHGRRSKPGWMTVEQAIYRRGGGRLFIPSRARLHFFDVGYQWGGSFWKMRDPLRFELWRVDSRHKKVRRVRVGPKQFYCLRDLERTRPGKRSPESWVYPGCNQNPLEKQVVLGTSVGWSDIYPSTYDNQWINVTGLRGCFAYLLRVDPHDLLVEKREGNNSSQRLVHLPYRSDHRRC